MLKTLAVLATIPAVAVPALADAPETILVSARVPVTAAELGGSVTVLTKADLDRLQVPLLIDVLKLQPGVTFSRNGGPGGFTAVRLRGAEGEQTTLVIDGVKVADTASPGGGADFANISTANVGRVEILRGPQSLAWGSQAIGGVIAVETAAPGEELAADARLEAGSRNSWLARADASGKLGPAAISVGGNWQKTDGISAASEARGATERDDFESYGANARADVEIVPGLIADLRGRFQHSDVGLDGFPPPTYALADTDDRQRTRELSGVAGLGYRGESFFVRAGWQISDVDRRSTTPGATPETTFTSDGRLERLDLRGDWRTTGWLTLAGGAEREISRIRTEDQWSVEPFRARSRLQGVWGQALLAPIEGLNLQAGVRHDDHSRFGGATTFAASGSYQLIEPLRLKASWGEGFKAPTLYQLFSDYGNETLQPERAKGWDAGAELNLLHGALTASVTLFQRVTRNQIDFVSCWGVTDPICTNRPWGTYDNVARTRAKGVELGLGLKPVEGFTLGVQSSWINARNRTEGAANEGKRLARRPGQTLSLVGDYQAPAGWAFGATLSQVSSSFDDAANMRRIPGYLTADIRASIAFAERFELYGRITNLFDERYETASFYGAPGRQAFVGIRAKL
ncbi:TonB-dependent receptor [Sandaracinobacter neustonicus]|uniref:TonB-dependent receptor n=1 Tax=Sandaracinobacter neustonicus TaxID=1715348 RepID=A0A501XKA0_9SPHN|nr:TonB-dependent receptor [Sandaracinobacter neustonicus]TPE61000.1 TonB-dependent receptor [Sandaracinobacter neustonicus]